MKDKLLHATKSASQMLTHRRQQRITVARMERSDIRDGRISLRSIRATRLPRFLPFLHGDRGRGELARHRQQNRICGVLDLRLEGPGERATFPSSLSESWMLSVPITSEVTATPFVGVA